MSTPTLSPLRLLALSIVGTTIVVGGVILAVVALWQPHPLEVYLPADRTVAMLALVTREDLRSFEESLPALKSVPDFAGSMNVGIVALADNSMAWIVSPSTKDAVLPAVNVHVGHQGFLASDPSIATLLTGRANLRTSVPFSALTTDVPFGAHWAYIANRQSPELLLPSMLRPLVHASGAVLFAKTGDTASLRIFGQTGEVEKPVYSAVPKLLPAPDAFVTVGDPQQVLAKELEGKSPEEQTVLRGIIAKKAVDLLGGNWSYTYDILPLLQGQSTFAWSATASSGSLPFLLHGTPGDIRMAKETLTRFHEAFRTRNIGNDVIHRTFDKGFASTIIRSDPSQMEDHQVTVNGWIVRQTGVTGGPQLLSAVRGGEFLLSDTESWMKTLTGADTGDSLPRLAGAPFAGGSLSPSSFMERKTEMRNEPEWAWLAGKHDPANTVLWSAARDGQGRILSLTLSQL